MTNLLHSHINEQISVSKLPSGVILYIESIPHYQSVATGFFLNRGSRDEELNQGGYTHFCEHMLFKGTSHSTKDQISTLFDEMGGYINAYTTHELVVIYNRFPSYYFNENIRLIHDIFHNSQFPGSEIYLERKVIVSEIHEELEDAHEKCHEDFMARCFPGQSLGQPVIGSEKSVINAGHDDLFSYYKKSFTASDLIISICGNVDHDTVLKQISDLKFRKREHNLPTYSSKTGEPGVYQTLKSAEQVHLILGTADFELDDTEYIQFSLLNTILGESMSSRFWRRIRDDLGLCYSIYTFLSRFRNENLFGLYFSVLPENLDETINETSAIVRSLLRDGITKEELLLAQRQKIGELIMDSDQVHKRMIRSAISHLRQGRHIPLSKLFTIINNTSVADLNRLLSRIFVQNKMITQVLYPEPLEIQEWQF